MLPLLWFFFQNLTLFKITIINPVLTLLFIFCAYLQAFQAYDVNQTASVTKGEFRRVLESFCTPLTTEQFEAVLAKV